MQIVKANDRVLFIKRSGVFLPIACLTSNGMNEGVEMIPTTTRFSQGWETARPNLQNGSLNFEGLALETLFNSEVDELNKTTIFINFSDFADRFTQPSSELVSIGFDFFFNGVLAYITSFRLTNVAPAPAGTVLKGITFADTMQNIKTFLEPFDLGTISVTSTGLKFEMNDLGNWTAFSSIIPTNYTVSIVIQNEPVINPIQLVSYDRLRQIKRNRERITWRVRSLNPFVGKFYDEGEGYIVDISEENAAGIDSTFNGTIQMWGEPKVIANNLALAADALNFLEDGNDNLIEP